MIGSDYQSQSPVESPATTLNWYYEPMEDQNVKSAAALYATPGLKKLWTLMGGNSIRDNGLFSINGRVFTICGTNFYELFQGLAPVIRGAVANDEKWVKMVASPKQILVLSAGIPYVFDLTANTLTAIPAATLVQPLADIEYLDGFFIALVANSAQIFASSPLDATTWPGDSTTIVSVFPGNVRSMQTTHRELILQGEKQSVAYYDSGATPFPLDVVDGSLAETGIEAPASRINLDNSIFWIGGDERGQGIAWRANGYTPQRVSTFAVEYQWRKYAKISDAVSYNYQEAGHTFWLLRFPTAGATWCYDVATGLWHRRGFLNKNTGNIDAHHSCCHVFAFEKHLVGDWSSPTIYEMSILYYDDAGNEIQRLRRSPPVGLENEWLYHKQMEVYLETGLGPFPPFRNQDGSTRGPQLMVRWSNDSGRTWSNQHFIDCGQGGDFKTRAILRRLGRARNRIYEISATDPVPWRIVDGFLMASPNYQPEERLAHRFGKMT